MIYKYYGNHHVDARHYARMQLQALWANAGNPFVSPIRGEIDLCCVVGCGHSGTTLMAGKLGNAPECYLIGHESWAFVPSRGLYSASRIVWEWIYMARSMGKRVLIEKTPKHVHAIGRIKRVVPEARFIAMTRNPLDNCASLVKRFGQLSLAIERWNMDNEAVWAHRNDPHVKVVRYEDLTCRPEATFQDVCAFLSMPYTPELIGAGATAYNQGRPEGNLAVRADQVSRAITPNVGTWKTVLSEAQADRVLRETGTIAARLGYTREPLSAEGVA